MPLTGEYEPSTSDWARENAEEYMQSGGTRGAELNGRPVILLTTVGAKTGKLRKTPLMRVERDGSYAIVASLGGAPKNPVWYHNVKANPEVQIQIGARKRKMIAREASPQEEAQLWPKLEAMYPEFAEYRARCEGVRHIPVLIFDEKE